MVSIDNNSRNNKQRFQYCKWILQTTICPSLTWKHHNPRPFSFSCERYIAFLNTNFTFCIYIRYMTIVIGFEKSFQRISWRIVYDNGHFQILIIVDMSIGQYKLSNPTLSSPKSSSSATSFGSNAITCFLSTKKNSTSATPHLVPLQLHHLNEGTFVLLPWPLLPRVHKLFATTPLCPLELSSNLWESLTLHWYQPCKAKHYCSGNHG